MNPLIKLTLAVAGVAYTASGTVPGQPPIKTSGPNIVKLAKPDEVTSNQDLFPLCVYLHEAQLKNGEFEKGWIPGSSRQIAKRVFVLADDAEDELLGRRGGVKKKDVEQTIKRFEEEAKKANDFISKHPTMYIEISDGGITGLKKGEPVLRPKTSPREILEKYPLAKYGLPIIFEEEKKKTINLDSTRLVLYIDPVDNTKREGIQIEYEGTNETFLLVPDATTIVIKSPYDGLTVIRRHYFRPVLLNK